MILSKTILDTVAQVEVEVKGKKKGIEGFQAYQCRLKFVISPDPAVNPVVNIDSLLEVPVSYCGFVFSD